jgi:hypothetical protein
VRVAFAELDLELDPAEEGRSRVEDQPVHTGLETRQEVGDPSINVGLFLGDELAVPMQLDAYALRGAAALGVEHMGRERGHSVNLSA